MTGTTWLLVILVNVVVTTALWLIYDIYRHGLHPPKPGRPVHDQQ